MTFQQICIKHRRVPGTVLGPEDGAVSKIALSLLFAELMFW